MLEGRACDPQRERGLTQPPRGAELEQHVVGFRGVRADEPHHDLGAVEVDLERLCRLGAYGELVAWHRSAPDIGTAGLEGTFEQIDELARGGLVLVPVTDENA